MVASLPRRSWRPCVAPPRLVTPRLGIQPPPQLHISHFSLKEKYDCLTAERISKPHAGNIEQLGGDVICEQYLFIAVTMRATKISILKKSKQLCQKGMKHRQGHCLVHRLRHIGIALPESCPDRAIVKTKGFSCLFSLVVCRQVASAIALWRLLKLPLRKTNHQRTSKSH